MDTSVIKKKIGKMSTKEISSKLEKNAFTPEEKEVAEVILQKRNSETTGYRNPEFEQERESIMKDLTKKQISRDTKVVPPVIKPKTISKTPSKGLTEEDSQKIKSLLTTLPSNFSKKEIITTLFDKGFTKQQIEKYRPEIAHWSYIYNFAKQIGK